jgi:hypothetical protein
VERRVRQHGERLGKSDRPAGGRSPDPLIREGADAEAALTASRRRTISRRELARRPRFEQVSPEVGQIDEAAVEQGLIDDPDATLALLADLTAATDHQLRLLAQRLAARIVVDLARRGPSRRRGVGRLVEHPYRPDGGDLDLDASLDAVVEARSANAAVDVERLRVRSWSTPQTALCLLVDRSGSMGGKPLATAALAAAAIALRNPMSYSVLAFERDVVVVKSQDGSKSAVRVVTDVLALRGHGTTDLAGALRAAGRQLAGSQAGRRVVVLLSDCRATVEGDAVTAAIALPELVVIAPSGDQVEAAAFTQQCGARLATVDGPSTVIDALTALFDR